MQTDDLIKLLSSDAEPVDRHARERFYAIALAVSVPISVFALLMLIGIRPDLSAAASSATFWIKLAFVGGIMWGSLLMTLRLSQPGRRLGWTPLAFAAPIFIIWMLGLQEMAQAAPEQRAALFWGTTWRICPFIIMALSIPVVVAAMLAMRELAPTHLSQAGLSLGLLSGSTGALVYCLHCPETSTPFIGTWYLLGICVPGLFGMVFGRALLRW